MIVCNPYLAYVVIDFSDFFMINVMIYFGYWFLFQRDYLFNSFTLLRYQNKNNYYQSFLKLEIGRIFAYVSAYVLIAFLSRVIMEHVMPGPSDPIHIGRVLSFELVTVGNLLILRFLEQLISMGYNRIAGNLFYVFYVVSSTLISFYVARSPQSTALSILSQFYRSHVFSIAECVISYAIVFALIILLLRKIKRGSVNVWNNIEVI